MDSKNNKTTKGGAWQRLTAGMSSYTLEYLALLGSLGFMLFTLAYVVYMVNDYLVNDTYNTNLDQVLGMTASLIVLAPVAIILMRRIENQEKRNPADLQDESRKVFGSLVVMFSLFQAVMILIYSFVAILYALYDLEGLSIKYLPTLAFSAFITLVYAKYVGSRQSIDDDSRRKFISRLMPVLAAVSIIALVVTPAFLYDRDEVQAQRALEDARRIARTAHDYVVANTPSATTRSSATALSVLVSPSSFPESLEQSIENHHDLSSQDKNTILSRAEDYNYTLERISHQAAEPNQYNGFRVCVDLDSEVVLDSVYYYAAKDYNKKVGNDLILKKGVKYSEGTNCFSYLYSSPATDLEIQLDLVQ